MNQSRPRKLSRDGDADGPRASGCDGGDGSPSPPVGLRSIGCLVGRANRLLLQVRQGLNGCRVPAAPSTTIGLSSLYSGAAIT
jgi:hypothetical protein